LRYPYEVRDEKEYFDEIQDVKVTKDMLDLAKHIVNQKSATFEPEKFEDHYEEALTELINAKRNGKMVGPRPRPRGENVVDLMDALKKSIASETSTKGKKPRKASVRRRCSCRSKASVVQRRRRQSLRALRDDGRPDEPVPPTFSNSRVGDSYPCECANDVIVMLWGRPRNNRALAASHLHCVEADHVCLVSKTDLKRRMPERPLLLQHRTFGSCGDMSALCQQRK
jgi:hypothetical protein